MILPLNFSFNLFIHKYLVSSRDTMVNRIPPALSNASLLTLSLFSAQPQLAFPTRTLVAGLTGHFAFTLPLSPAGSAFLKCHCSLGLGVNEGASTARNGKLFFFF